MLIHSTTVQSTPSAVSLTGRLTPAQLEHAAKPLSITIEPDVVERVARCRRFVLDRLTDGTAIYGATTGFGPLVAFAGRGDSAGQCDNILSHLTAGQGDDLPPSVVRAAILARLWSLSRGHSGISLETLLALRTVLASDFAPAVPRIGSLGASGDLIPLAHIAQVLRGRGAAYLGDERLPADQALQAAGLAPLELDGRDGLALVNGTSVTSAVAGLAVASARRSHTAAMLCTALMIDILGSEPVFLSADLLRAFGHSQAEVVAAQMRALLDGCVPSGRRPLQEPYSIRCTPQLLGAVGNSLHHAEDVIDADLNGVSDNPLFFPELDTIVHGGNFFGQPVAFAADQLVTAVVQMGNLAERQLDLLIDPHRNGGLAPMLATVPGEQHGVQGVQIAATAALAGMRRAAMPASVQSLPTNGHNQDVVPFGTQAALNALDLAKSVRWLHGSLAVALRQALHVGGRTPTAAHTRALAERLMDTVPPVDPDRPLDADVRLAADQLDLAADELSPALHP
ncbi:aromatic amino acid ammonia-lyase [Nocardia wallacei]|uniref:aromatic amino acid ammonia-lyase n=1 Tax=Nocardia wallacei TaxID=480035 RepID=UPI0024573990|nr:aromatic amino acid ammonia-lyase [Nocardia wallacei]